MKRTHYSAFAITLAAGLATTAHGQDITRDYQPWALGAIPVPAIGPFPTANGAGMVYGSQSLTNGLIRTRSQVTGAAAAPARNQVVTHNLTQAITMGGGANRVNIYTVLGLRGRVQQPATGVTSYSATATLVTPGAIPNRTITISDAALPGAGGYVVNDAASGNIYAWNFDLLANQPPANAAYTLNNNTTIRAQTNAAAANVGLVNDVDFDSTINAGTTTEYQHGFLATTIASPIGLANSRAKIGVERARAVGNKLLINGNTNTGQGVRIGEMELGRPSRLHADLPNNTALFIDPAANAASFADEHALAVAGIISGRSATAEQRGVAPASTLYASAFTAYAGNVNQQINQSAAYLMETSRIRVMNGSFGAPPLSAPFNPALSDGDNHIARLFDWSVENKNTVIVMAAGNNGATASPPPGGRGYEVGNPNPGGFDRPQSINGGAGGFNVITVGALDYDFTSRAYYSSLGTTRGPVGRSKPDLVAPGTFILSTSDADLNRDGIYNDYERVFMGTGDLISPANRRYGGAAITGTSFAAPHITGAAGVMVEYGNKVQDRGAANADRTDPRVIKCAMMNTADRSVLQRDGSAWSQSITGDTITRPLDPQLGAGMLDVNAAMNNLWPAEARLENNLPGGATSTAYIKTSDVGWDVQRVAPAGANESRISYWLANGLVRGSRVRATTVWNAHVAENNAAGGTVGTIDMNDTYNAAVLNNLELQMWDETPAKERAPGVPQFTKLISSVSTRDNVQLIHDFRVNANREYYFDVVNKSANAEDFAITWTTVSNAAAAARRLSPSLGPPSFSHDPTKLESTYALDVSCTFDAPSLLSGIEQLALTDDDGQGLYTPGLYDIYLGPEVRFNSSDAGSELSWYDGDVIDFHALMNSTDSRGNWEYLGASGADGNGFVIPMDVSLANAPEFFARLASIGMGQAAEYNYAIDVNRDGIFTPGLDAAGWFQVVPEPGVAFLLSLGLFMTSRRRRTTPATAPAPSLT